jgi:predicted nuclease with TOPRIM domain
VTQAKRDLQKEEEEIQGKLRELHAQRHKLEDRRVQLSEDEAKIIESQSSLKSQLQELDRLEHGARKKKDSLLGNKKKWEDSEKNKLRIFGKFAVEVPFILLHASVHRSSLFVLRCHHRK